MDSFSQLADMIGDVAYILIITLAIISTILAFAEALGFLPLFITKWMTKNRLAFSLELLNEMGVKIEQKQLGGQSQSTQSLKARLKTLTINERVTVGQIENATFNSFIDLQGGTTTKKVAIFFARELATHLRINRILTDKMGNFEFDFVACPKDGSPILAYEFANIVDKPVILRPSQEKFRGSSVNLKAIFDVGETEPLPGERCLIVDDSSTGGHKVMDLVKDLRQFGYEVADCLVVFEPKGKDAGAKLKEMGVTLHSIIAGPEVING